MSGHSKWSTIKHQKEATDQKKGQAFTKLSNFITIAVKESGGVTDPNSNFRLRLAIDKAKNANMPKDNITRAITRASKSGSSGGLEEVSYEGYGPLGVSIIVKTATDNRARTTAEIKNIFDKYAGKLSEAGSVIYLFKFCYHLVFSNFTANPDEIMSLALDAGADDYILDGANVIFIVSKENINMVKSFLTAKKIPLLALDEYFQPLSYTQITDTSSKEKIILLLNKLESLDEVQKVFSNLKLQI